jgi:heptosyltransferase-3
VKLLFVKPKQIGDSLILTPTLAAVRKAYPDAEIWVLTRTGCEGILAGCPMIDRLLSIAPVERRDRKRDQWLRDAKVLKALRKVRFDYVFELGDGHRGRWFSFLSRKRRAYSVKPATPLNWVSRMLFTAVSEVAWDARHRVEKDFQAVAEFLPLPRPIPRMIFDRNAVRDWAPAALLTSFAVMNIGTRQKWNRWNREGWLKVGEALLGRFPNLVVACGPVDWEIEESAWLRERLGERVLCTLGKTTWAEFAGLLYRAKLLVCPNTAAMHLGAACGCPVVALFGPTAEEFWYPWLTPFRIVIPREWTHDPADPHALGPLSGRHTSKIDAEDVVAACEALLAAGISGVPDVREANRFLNPSMAVRELQRSER